MTAAARRVMILMELMQTGIVYPSRVLGNLFGVPGYVIRRDIWWLRRRTNAPIITVMVEYVGQPATKGYQISWDAVAKWKQPNGQKHNNETQRSEVGSEVNRLRSDGDDKELRGDAGTPTDGQENQTVNGNVAGDTRG